MNRRVSWGGVARYGVLTLGAVAYAIPLYIAVTGAFRPSTDIVRSPIATPGDTFTLDNLTGALSDPSFNVWASYAVSFGITATSVALLLTIAGMLAYVVSRSTGRAPRILMFALLLGLMLPPQVLLLPAIQVLRHLNVIFTYQGLVLYNGGLFLAFACFVLIRFIDAVPRELDEAATMDGAGPLRIYWTIVFPLLAPAVATMAVLLFIFIWNDFVNPFVLLGSSKGETITTGVYRAVGQYSSDYGQMFAFIVLASAPIVVLYLAMQRRVIGALLDGSVKG